MTDTWAIVGGGFKGIIGAYLLASMGRRVVLIESAKVLGSVLSSIPWKGFYLDKGCHLFSHDDEETSRIILDILGEDFEPVHVRYASVINQKKTDEIAIPFLGSFGEAHVRQILYELTSSCAQPAGTQENLGQVLVNRYGPTAAQLLDKAARKIYQTGADDLDASALAMTPFRRVAFLQQDMAYMLKQLPALDDLIAAPSQNDPMRFVHHMADRYAYRNFYPTGRGMYRFCERAQDRLQAMGVTLRLDTKLEKLDLGEYGATITLGTAETLKVDRVLWAAGPELFCKLVGAGDSLQKWIHGVPMALFYFSIRREEGSYTYVQNYDMDSLVYRASVPGEYVKNSACPEGLSYICCEVPTTIGSAVWNNPAQYTAAVWQEISQLGVTRSPGPLESMAVTVPSTYRLPRAGYWTALNEMLASVQHVDTVDGLEQWDLFKNSIALSLRQSLRGI